MSQKEKIGMNNLTKEEFIKRAKKTHKDKYDYSKVVYINARTKVIITCKFHGDFLQVPSSHIYGQGCIECRYHHLTSQQFIKEAKKVHGNKYDYSKSVCGKSRTLITIVCKKHGEFKKTAYHHLKGAGCQKCAKVYRPTTEEFITKLKSIHYDKYEYSQVIYKGAYTKINIMCPLHGSFTQTATDHLSGRGCPWCRSSKGELKIKNYLDNKDIKFIREVSFDDLISDLGNPLRFDFAILNINDSIKILIEFDGRQHFQYSKLWMTEEQFKQSQYHDKLKNEYCIKNNIKLLRIKYDQNVEECLDKFLNEINN